MVNEPVPSRNILVIAYYFPPMGLSGVQRTLKFVKYLPEFGWKPTVLTVTPTGYFAQDPTLLEELEGRDVEIARAGSLDPNRLFKHRGVVKMPSERNLRMLTFLSDSLFIPDNKIGWRRKAMAAASELFSRIKFDVIFATAPPFTDFLIGVDLHEKFHVPLVLDYRDPWHMFPFKYFPTPYHRWRHSMLEQNVLKASSRIITTNRRVKELILKEYEFLRYKDIVIIPQGYDPADIPQELPRERNGKFIVTHAGVFSGDRTPKYFLRALKKIIADQPDLAGSIEARFVGIVQDNFRKLVKTLGLDSNVVITGYLPHRGSIREIQLADMLWLMLPNDVQSPGKLYEYIGARKPILACAPEGFIRQTVLETGAGVAVDPDDVNGIAAAILDMYQMYREGRLPQIRDEVAQKYDRVFLTNELSKVLGFLAE